MNKKNNKNAKVDKFTIMLGIAVRLIVPRALAKAGDIKTHSSVLLSVRPSLRLSVTKTLTWLISSEVLKIEH